MTVSAFEGYDLIGDVHGCALSLRMLLERLGYRCRDGVYRHANRQAIFLGDIVDRGPRIREAVSLVRGMVDAGAAQIVMGNHEYNFLCYCTPGRPGSGLEYLREHTPRHHRILKETLAEFEPWPDEKRDVLDWILTLPLFLEIDGFRVIHACWPGHLLERFGRIYGGNRINREFLYRSAETGTFEWMLMDRALRGTHLKLPNDEVILSKDGFQRRFFRTKFWAETPEYYADVVFQPDPLPEHIARMPLGENQRDALFHYGPDEKPLFIGHYWREGEPAPITDNIACLDYSAVKYGKLVAYRYDGEHRLEPGKFVWVDVLREVSGNVDGGPS